MKTLIFKKYDQIKFLGWSFGICALLITVRMKVTGDLTHLYLVWNLFLAYLPLAVAWWMATQERVGQNKFIFFCGLACWLAFLPNSPYILTDFVHVLPAPQKWRVFDTLMISAFALSGLLAGFYSIIEVQRLLVGTFNKKELGLFTTMISILCGYGVFLGRFWRFNSWDVIADPLSLVTYCLNTILYPIAHWQVWAFTMVFGLFLKLVFVLGEKFLPSIHTYDHE